MDTENKHRLLLRLRRIEGQVRGLQRMVEQEQYCMDILTQTASTVAALHAIRDKLLHEHIESCVAETMEHGNREDKSRRINEVITVINRFRK